MYAEPALAGWTPTAISASTFNSNQYAPTLVPDGAGGTIALWQDDRSVMPSNFASRTDASGNALWLAAGVNLVVPTAFHDPSTAVSDGVGGVIAVWTEFRNGIDWDVYAQRLDGSGNAMWGANGVPVCTAVGDQTVPVITHDAAGGAFVTWEDRRSPNDAAIYARRIDAAGNALWVSDGIAVCTASGGQSGPRIGADSIGGAVVIWNDGRNGNSDVYAAQFDASGNQPWAVDGVAVADLQFSFEIAHDVVSDGTGGVIVAFLQQTEPPYTPYRQWWVLRNDSTCSAIPTGLAVAFRCVTPRASAC
jgi:hypothetical protein